MTIFPQALSEAGFWGTNEKTSYYFYIFGFCAFVIQ